jgi:hypothetical protein
MLMNLRYKWRVQSIFPLDPRGKQPAFHIHARKTWRNEESIWHIALAV